MRRLRIAVGFLAGLLLLASGLAHSLLGWKQLGAELETAHAPPDLAAALRIGWHFGGVAMLVFGCIVLLLFREALGNRPVSLRPALVIGIAYVAFGGWGFFGRGMNPFFFVFIVPGILLVAASWRFDGRRRGRSLEA